MVKYYGLCIPALGLLPGGGILDTNLCIALKHLHDIRQTGSFRVRLILRLRVYEGLVALRLSFNGRQDRVLI